MKLVQTYLTNNPCYKQGRTITPKGLMLHSVGVNQPNAATFVGSWNKSTYNRACVHAFIDANTGTIYQTLPWNFRGWHCGDKANNTHIGVECCEPACIKYTSGSSFTCTDKAKAKEDVERTYKAAVELFAHLCTRFKLNPLEDGVILSHSEGYKRGIASAHDDIEHLWNGLHTGYTMNGFRRDVSLAMKGKEKQSTNYLVRVTATKLNIRQGAGTNYKIVGSIEDKGIYTIIDEKKGQGAAKWGKLKSGAGWISLDYTKRI